MLVLVYQLHGRHTGLAAPPVNVNCFGTEFQPLDFIQAYVGDSYDLTLRGIISCLRLLDVDYNLVSTYGHVGKPGLPWEE